MIKLIVAYDKNGLIGINDKMPWDIKEEMQHFQKTTLNKTILMGDITFMGIGKPLPNRKTIILTLNKKFKYDHKDVEIINDINLIIKKYKNNLNKDIFICGGSTIYELFIPFVDEMIISKVKGTFKGNKYFPKWDKNKFKLKKNKEYKEFNVEIYERI